MVKKLLAGLLIFGSFAGKAQNDTTYLYFNKDWKPVAKAQAVFYGKVIKEGSYWHRMDYWAATNIMQMNGLYKDSATQVEEGPCTYYNEDGKIKDSTNYVNGKTLSEFYYYPNGHLKADIVYDANGKTLGQEGYDEFGHLISGYVVQMQAQFPGGVSKWQEYLVSGLQKNQPKSYKRGKVWGGVTVAFTINKDGKVVDVKVGVSSGYPELDEHAVNIISNSPDWIPAIQFGKNVIYRQKQQITYAQQQ